MQITAGYLTMMTTYEPKVAQSSYPVIKNRFMMAGDLAISECRISLLRFMAIEDEKKLSLSRRVATTWVVISLL